MDQAAWRALVDARKRLVGKIGNVALGNLNVLLVF
jgi:hypothetical protein